MGASFLKGAVVGIVCAVLGGATVALAGSGIGGVFNLGQSNSVDAKTTLTGASPGIQLQVTNTSAAAGTSGLAVNSASAATTGVFTNTGGGSAGGFFVNAGVKPFTVNSQTKVGNLNADLLDGLDSSALQKRVTGTCAAGSAVRLVNGDGTVACQAVAGGGGWGLTGNAGTSPTANFLGTTDARDLVVKTNGAERLRVTQTGDVGIGTTGPTARLQAVAGGGAAVAGENNSPSAPTMKATNDGTGPAAAFVSSGAPFTVNSTTKVVNLNADKLDGLDAAQLAGGVAVEQYQVAGTITGNPTFGSCTASLFTGLPAGKTIVLDYVEVDANASIRPEFILWRRQQTGSGFFTHFMGVPLSSFSVNGIYSGEAALNDHVTPGSSAAGDISDVFVCLAPGSGAPSVTGRYIMSGHLV